MLIGFCKSAYLLIYFVYIRKYLLVFMKGLGKSTKIFLGFDKIIFHD